MRFDTNEERDLVIAEQARTIREMQAMLEQVPLEAGVGGGTTQIYEIVDGQILPPANIDGIEYVTSAVTVIDDDPTASGVRGSGMGRAQNMQTGEFIMVVHDNQVNHGAPTALRESHFGISVATQTSPGGTVYHYIARF